MAQQTTNSLVNMVMQDAKPRPPEAGMGITLLRWTDRDPGTITRVAPDGKKFWFKADDAKFVRGNALSEDQTYEYTPDAEAAEQEASLTKEGKYKAKGGSFVLVGHREKYRDPRF